jgi:hypothetical protein
MNALVDGESKIARNSPGTIIPERPGSRAISLQITVGYTLQCFLEIDPP